MKNSTEHRMATQKRRQDQGLETEATEQAALLLDADEHLVDLPGVDRKLISLTGKAWERALLWRLDWVNFLYAFPAPVPQTKRRKVDG